MGMAAKTGLLQRAGERSVHSQGSRNGIRGRMLSAPSIEVEGDVVSTANGIIECAGLLSAAYVEAGVYSIMAGSLVCKKVSVPSTLIVRDSFSCTGPAEVDGTLVLPLDTTQEDVEALNATGDGLIFVGPKAYKPDGTPVDGATIMLFDGSDASDTGLTWDGSTCTLTLDGFTRTYQEENVETYGIMIFAPGKDVTLVLKGTNGLTGLPEDTAGILAQAASLTLAGDGSLGCEGDPGLVALGIEGGELRLAQNCELRDGKELMNAGGIGFIMESDGATPAASFALRQTGYAVTLHPNGGTIAAGKDVTAYPTGTGAALPTAADMTREGYTFAGWYDNAALTGSPVTAIGATETGDKAYWAKWDPVPGGTPVSTEPPQTGDGSHAGLWLSLLLLSLGGLYALTRAARRRAAR